jgi:hypothetical protein
MGPVAPANNNDLFMYYMSLFGGAAVGGALTSMGGSGTSIVKGALISGGASSALYLYLKESNFTGPGSADTNPAEYFTSYAALGCGMGWAATNGKKGATAGCLLGLGTAAIKVAFRHYY